MSRSTRRFTTRTRTVLALVALAAVGMACMTGAFRREVYRFQKRHSDLAHLQLHYARQCRGAEHAYRAHEAGGHRCEVCSRFGRPPRELREAAGKEAEVHERDYRWHAFLAGPVFGYPMLIL